MQIVRIVALLCFLESTAGAQSHRVITEDFSSDPLLRGWKGFGPTDLIHWNREAQNLAVTWDSSRPNACFSFPLETILQRSDDFEVSLDLTLDEFAAGVSEGKRGTFQIAFGFQNFADASSTNFLRAVSGKSPNLVEFNFMPDTGFGPTVWPAMFTTNGAMNYSGASDFSVFDLPTGVTMRVTLAYTSTNETASIAITAEGVLVGPVTAARLATNDVAFGKAFTQFQVDAFAISSYSDSGYGGSVLAHGTIDSIQITAPPPAIREVAGAFVNGAWEVKFLSQINWRYTLQRTADFVTWIDYGTVIGHGDRVALQDADSSGAAFYRIHAQRLD